MKAVAAALAAWCGLACAADSTPGTCPPGETIQWMADYCMASIGTDDEIAASDCIAEQGRISFGSACTARAHFKRALCEIVVRNGSRPGTVDACVADPSFAGRTVRRGGVGG